MSSHGLNPMKNQSHGIPSLHWVWKTTLSSLKNNPAILIPFAVFAVAESLTLFLTYLAPRAPFKLLFGPIIRTFWGEKFLHYPTNFLLLPKLASLNRMALYITLGSLLSGMAIAIICDIHRRKKVDAARSFRAASGKYVSLFVIILIYMASFTFLTRIVDTGFAAYFNSGHTKLLFIKAGFWMGPVLLSLNFLLALITQSAFIYAIPVLLMDEEKLSKSILKSFQLFKRLFIPTIILVGLPMLLYIPLMVFEFKAGFLVNRLFPESVLLVLFSGIIVNSLVLDPLITTSATFLYLADRDKRQ